MTKRSMIFGALILLTLVDCKRRTSESSHALNADVKPQSPTSDFTYEQLTALLLDPNTKSIDDLLPRLPESFRKRFTLVYRSGSAQFSHPLYPRVIMFSSDASLVIAFEAWPIDMSQFSPNERPIIEKQLASANHNALEVIHFERGQMGSQWKFKEVIFSPDQVGVHPRILDGSADNPLITNCSDCHGTSTLKLKPNWETYAIWPGVYGAIDDYILPDSNEGKGFEQFVKKTSRTGRYRALINLNRDPIKFIKKAVTVENKDRKVGASSYTTVGYKDDIYWSTSTDEKAFSIEGAFTDIRPRPALLLLFLLTSNNSEQIVSLLRNVKNNDLLLDLMTLTLCDKSVFINKIAKRLGRDTNSVQADIDSLYKKHSQQNQTGAADIMLSTLQEYFPQQVSTQSLPSFGQNLFDRWAKYSDADTAGTGTEKVWISPQEQLTGRGYEASSGSYAPDSITSRQMSTVQYLLNLHHIEINLTELTTPRYGGLRDSVGGGAATDMDKQLRKDMTKLASEQKINDSLCK